MTPETESLVSLDVDELLRLARGRALPPAEVLAAARRRNRAEAVRFLSRMWTLALRGPIAEPHAPEWDSRLRATVAEALAARLLGFGVDADLTALLVSAWAATFTDPPLAEDEVLAIVRELAPLAQEAA